MEREIDITEKIHKYVKILAAGILVGILLCTAGIYFYRQKDNVVTIYDAKVAGAMVGVRTRVNGRIASIDAADESTVEAGARLAEIEVSITDEDLANLEQNLELAKQNLAEIKKGRTVTVPVVNAGSAAGGANLAQAEARYNRMKELFEMGAISAMKRDEAAAEYETAKSAAQTPAVTYETRVEQAGPETIEAAELAVRQAEIALKNAKEDAQATTITAPVAGTMHIAEFAAGSEVKAGDTLFYIGDAESVWIEARVNDSQKERLKLGQLAVCEIDGRELKGTVAEIETKTDEADETATEGTQQTDDGKSAVKISLPPESMAAAKFGQKAVVKISVEEEKR